MEFIDLKQQYNRIKSDVQKEINEVLESGQFIMGNKVSELEKVLEQYTNSKHCITVADGSKAILIALMALGVRAGDEVIVPSFTFIATASMVALLGASPVFVDVDPKTYNIDVNQIKNAITNKTKAIIAVSLYGQCADIDGISQIAKPYGIKVIEDAAQSFGASYKGNKSGNLADITCTSFFPSKPLGCYGDGGACFTNDENIATIMKQIRVHGQDKRYHHALLGVNGRLDTIQAAVLLAKMRIFDDEVANRIKIGANYSKKLSHLPCQVPVVLDNQTHVYAQYTLVVDKRDELINYLNSHQIPTAVHYPIPLHKQPALQQYYHGQELPNSEYLSEHVLSLPMHPYLTEDLQDKVVDVVNKFFLG